MMGAVARVRDYVLYYSLLDSLCLVMTMEVHGGDWNFLSIWKTLPSRILILLLRYITREMGPEGGAFLFLATLCLI